LDYVEVKFSLNENHPILALMKQELGDLGYDAFEENDTVISAFINKNLFAKEKLEGVVISYSNYIKSKDIISHAHQNWNKNWEESFDPVFINEKCMIRASFHSSKGYPYEIIIDPEMSFGTGHHETTRLIAKAIFENSLFGKKVLDFGSGTGVLSILAEKLGANHIDAIEIDKNALGNAINNGLKNNCKKINFIVGDGSFIPNLAYDLLLININKNTIKQEFKNILNSTKKGSVLLFSGFYTSDVDSLEELGKSNGLIPLYSSSENNWALLAMKS
jgi:ribosomal protein L11 methyltransferase